MAGYSQRTLAAKLGIKTGWRVAILNAPAGYADLLAPLPDGVIWLEILEHGLPFVHFFTTSRHTLTAEFSQLKAALKPDGMLWISWPKRTAKVPTDLDENIIREIGLVNGLVDVKVAAVDSVWSGLKFVYRLADRKMVG